MKFLLILVVPILISHEVIDRLSVKHGEYIDHIERVGVKYIRIMPEEDDPTSAIGRGWKSTFLCQDKGICVYIV